MPGLGFLLGAGNFFKSTWKLWVFAGVIALIVILLYMWRDEIRTSAYNSLFSDLVAQQNEELIADVERLQRSNAELMDQVRVLNQERLARREDFIDIIDRVESEGDGPLSPSLRQALRELRERQMSE